VPDSSEKAQAQQDAQQNFGDATRPAYELKGDSPVGYLKRGICEGDILLGDGFLERGSAVLLAGPSGIGKSSIGMQCGCCWSCGVPAFDLPPPRALRIVMVQNEDSPNDLVRMSEVVRHLGLDLELIRQNFWIETLRGKIGPEAVMVMREVVQERRADVLLINPISAYHDGDISQNRDNIAFLYGELGELLDSEHIGIFAFHHKGKPPRNQVKNSRVQDVYFDIMYDILGGSTLTNFFRGIITVSPIGNSDVFRFTVAKRFEQSTWPSKSQQFKWHEDRTKRLWVPASVAETDQAQAEAQKTIEDLRKFVPATGEPIPKTTLEQEACKKGHFTQKDFRAVLDQALSETTPDELRLYYWPMYNPGGGSFARIARHPQPTDQTPEAIKERFQEQKRRQKEAKRQADLQVRRAAKIVDLPRH
jgi:hypothetical protein